MRLRAGAGEGKYSPPSDDLQSWQAAKRCGAKSEVRSQRECLLVSDHGDMGIGGHGGAMLCG